MRVTLLTAIPLTLLLAGCGNDSGQQTSAPATEAAAPAAPTAPAAPAADATPPAEAAAPSPQVASESTAAPISDDAVVYDPIDVAKLQNSWWQQFSAGG